MRKLIVLTLAIALAACVGSRNRARVESGMLTLDLPQAAFLDVWGKPDRIYITSGQDVIEGNWGGGGPRFFKGRHTLEVWVYDMKKIELVFDRKKRLAAWKTEATVQELSTPKPSRQ